MGAAITNPAMGPQVMELLPPKLTKLRSNRILRGQQVSRALQVGAWGKKKGNNFTEI